MDVALFEKCIKYITKNFEITLFENYISDAKTGSGKKIASIMFDDGYEDNYLFAAPVLKKYNCKASFYVVTNSIDYNLPVWTYLIDYLFQKTNKAAINLDYSFLPEELRVDSLKNHSERIRYARNLKPFLKRVSNDQREIVVNEIVNAYTDVQVQGEMMNWDQIRQLKADGHYIGSHTVAHPVLGMMEEKAIRDELFLSGQRIKDELGYFPYSISYPVGSYNSMVKEIARGVGYKIGLAVNQKIYNPNKSDLFEVPRMELYNEPWWKTKLRISNRIEKIKNLIYW
jgi:peptidoglycan/xylan/chitin deacetylase (PgdA/CDA1 family)